MKNNLRTFLYFLTILMLMIACTKEVGLFTEVEFELTQQHEEEGYIKQPLSTTLRILPEEELEGNDYTYTYNVSKGEGHFENGDGEVLSGGEPIPFDALSSSIIYVGSDKGDHSVKVIAEDSFGFTEEVEISYTITDVPLIWTATATATQVELDKNVPITLTLENGADEVEVSFENRYGLSTGSGTLTGFPGEEDEVSQEFTSIAPGTYLLNFLPDALGTATLVFDLKDSNGQELQASVNLEVVEDVEDTVVPEIILLGDNPQEMFLDSEYAEAGATASDDIDGYLSDQIEIDATALDTTREGNYQVIYTVSDEDGNEATAVRTVTVVPDPDANQAPTAIDDNRNTVVDSAISFDPRTNDSDPENDTLTITAVGAVSPASAGIVDFDGMAITFTPAAGSTGTAIFSYTINDGTDGNDATATVTVTVEEVSIAATGITVTPAIANIDLGATRRLAATIEPADATEQGVTWSSSDPTVATVSADGTVTAIAAGNATITATSVDNGNFTDTATITVIPVVAVNRAPTAVNDRRSTVMDAAISFDPRGNDTDPENDLLTIIAVSGVAATNAGTVDFDGQSVTFTPASGSTETATFTYTINDGTPGNDATATITVTVEDTSVAVTGITLIPETAKVTEGQTRQLTATIQPANATDLGVVWNSNNTNVATVSQTGLVTAIRAGDAVITATSVDNGNVTDTATITVDEVIAPNEPPRAVDDARSITADEAITFDPRGNDTDPENDALTVTAVGAVNPASAGTVNFNGQSVTFTPASGSTETAIFTYTVNDGTPGNDASATVTITVENNPVLVTGIMVSSDRLNILDNETEQFTATVSPADADNSNVVWNSSNTGVATVDATGTVRAVSAGSTTITATARDGSNVTGSAELTVTASSTAVTGITVIRDRSSIPDNESEQFTAIIAPTNASEPEVNWSSSNLGVAIVNASGLVRAVSVGTSTITAAATDGSGVTGSAGITVTSTAIRVTGITVSSDRSSIQENETEQFAAIVSPANADNSNVNWSSSNPGVAIVNASTGLVTAVSGGTANIIATAADGSGVTGSRALEVTVNQPPIAVATSNLTSGDAPLTVRFTGDESSDPDVGDTLTYSWDFGDGSALSTEPNPSHRFTVPDTYTVVLRVRDASGATDTDTITIRVSEATNPNFSFSAGTLDPTPLNGFARGQSIDLRFVITPNSDMPSGSSYDMTMSTIRANLGINGGNYRENTNIPMRTGEATGIFQDASSSQNSVTVTFTVRELITGISKSRTLNFIYCTGNTCIQP